MNEIPVMSPETSPHSGDVVGQQPAFLVGVTGNMDISPEAADQIELTVQQLFRFLHFGGSNPVGQEAIAFLRDRLPEKVSLKKTYDDFFNNWPGLKGVPIVVLSSLAPGADQIVAKVALQPEFQAAGFSLRCPLPFPLKLYRQSTSFQREAKANASDAEQNQVREDNSRRAAELASLVPDDDDPRCFVAAMSDDMSLSLPERQARYQADLQNPEGRHRRYQTAGEYIAAYSQVMIAIWDHLDPTENDTGTSAIVRGRRAGLTRGLLPTTWDLNLPADGATFQIFTKREKRAAAERKNPESSVPDPTWSCRWLFPKIEREHFAELNLKPASDHVEAWQYPGFWSMLREAELLKGFAKTKEVDAQAAEQHLADLIRYENVSVSQDLKAANPTLFSRIARLAILRRRASDSQRRIHKAESDKTIAWLFLLTLIWAWTFDAFNHWHAKILEHAHHQPAAPDAKGEPDPVGQKNPAEVATTSESEPHDPNVDPEQPADATSIPAAAASSAVAATPPAEPSKATPAPHDDHPKAENPPKRWEIAIARLAQFLVGLAAALLVWRTLLYFRDRRILLHDETNHDLRALAEGTRIQLWWHLAGVGESVSANYLLRQRGELSWVRKAIRAVGMPYEWARWEFERLNKALQIKLLRCVVYQWVRGHEKNAQANYFQTAKARLNHRIHFWHTTGCIWALAGLWLAFLKVIDALFQVFGWHLLESLSQFSWRWGLYSVLILPATALIVCAYLYWRLGKNRDWEKLREKHLDPSLHFLVRTEDSRNFAYDPALLRQAIQRNLVIYLAAGLAVGILVFQLAVVLAHWAELPVFKLLLPGIGEWVVILGGMLLVTGGLSVAWPERNLCSEMEYQYQAMRSLFELAANRLELDIQTLEKHRHDAEDAGAAEEALCRRLSQLDEPAKAAFDREKFLREFPQRAEADYQKLLREIQQALYELGLEALDENAEWLVLHRSRPLEPLMPA